MFGPDSNPLPEGTSVTAMMSPLNSDDPKDRKEIKLMAKRSSAVWGGWFQGRQLVENPGEYKIEVPIPGTPDALRGKFLVKESNPELDQVRPDFAALYQMASEFQDAANQIPDKATAERLRAVVLSRRVSVEKKDEKDQPKAAETDKKEEKAAGDAPRLY